MQIFPLSEISERIEIANEGVKAFDIFQGHITSPTQASQSVLVMKIQRLPNGIFNPNQIAWINKMRGNFTVVIRPGAETFYVSSDPMNMPMQGSMMDNPMWNDLGGQYGNLSTNEYVKRLIELERENTALKAENDVLKKDLEQFQDSGGKFSYALNNLLEQFIFPKFVPGLNQQNQTAQPIQGTPMEGIQNIQIKGTPEEQLEAAFAVLLVAFGDDWIIKFATKLQQDPSKVQMIKQYLP